MLPKPLHCCYSSMQWSEGFAQNLTKLDVSSSKKLEDIISKEKATSNVTENDECLVTPFQKLEYLVLNDLPALKSIYWSPLSFPRLKEIFIKNNCLELRKLPLDSRSGVTNEELVIKYKEKEWMERVVWEDEATQHRFLPSCKFVKVTVFFNICIVMFFPFFYHFLCLSVHWICIL